MAKHTFRLNGKMVTVDVHPDVRLLWVLRDIIGVKGPKYGCGINVCKACTSHVNGRAFNPCAVRVGDIGEDDEITTIEGLPATVGKDLHPMQEAWLERDVVQCGYCQPGQIMAAVAKVKEPGGRAARSPRRTSTRSATSAAAAPTTASARRSWWGPRGCRRLRRVVVPRRGVPGCLPGRVAVRVAVSIGVPRRGAGVVVPASPVLSTSQTDLRRFGTRTPFPVDSTRARECSPR